MVRAGQKKNSITGGYGLIDERQKILQEYL